MNDVTIVGGGPTGLMLAGELALAGVEVQIVERRSTPDLVGTRARGFHSRTIELLDQRGIADRFLAAGRTVQGLSFAGTPLSVETCPSRHPYTLGLGQSHIERILLGWVEELGVAVRRALEVTGFGQDDTGVDVHLAEGDPIRTAYLVGADGGNSVIRKAAGIDFVGPEATRSHLIADVELTEEAHTGIRHDDVGIHAMNVVEDGRAVGIVVTEQQLGPPTEPTLADLGRALRAVYGTDFGVHDPRWISRFTDATRQAAAYRSGERHPATVRVLGNVMTQALLQRGDARTEAMRDTISDLLSFEGPRAQLTGLLSGLDVRYDLGEGHPLLGRRMPDLDLGTAQGPRRVFELLHDTRPVLLNLGARDGVDITPWSDRVQRIDADHSGTWELPVIGAVSAPDAVLIRPDGHVAWVGEGARTGLGEALTAWFGPPAG